MDRLCFSQSILNIDPVTQIRCFFNETMAIYNLSEGLNYNCIKGCIDSEDSIQFIISFNVTNEEVERIANSIIGRTVAIYNTVFYIEGSVNETELALRFNEVR